MTTPADMLAAALGYATLGWPVFPVRHDKTPHTTRGVLDATIDPDKIRQWWRSWPGANIAFAVGESSLLVLDYDPGADPRAVERAVPDLPSTGLVARTPRGGTHCYYRLPPDADPVASRQHPFAEHVDTRSFHGYVLLPPSKTKDGVYEWESRKRAAVASPGLLEACGRPSDKSENRDVWTIEPDLPDNVKMAREWLRGDSEIGSSKCRLAIEGMGGDGVTYATAAMMKSCGLSTGTALEIMWEEWNPRCEPPWEWEDLAVKIHNGYEYNTSPPGNVTAAYHVARAATGFTPMELEPMGSGRQVTSGRFRFVDRPGLRAIAPPEWLVPNTLPEDAYVMLVGASQSYKTTVALDLALTIASGVTSPRSLWGMPERPGPVLFTAGEGRAGIRQRVEAWERLHAGGDEAGGFVLADPVPRIGDDQLEDFIRGALEWHPEGYRLVVVDTVARAMQGHNENSQEAATAFTALADELRRRLGATVLALHHTGHENQTRARGSSAFLGDPDTILTCERVRPLLSRLEMAKQKDWEAWDQPRWAEIDVVSLGLDQKGVVATVGSAPPRQAADGSAETPMGLIDQAVLNVLKQFPDKEFTTTKLAEVLASLGGPGDDEGERVPLGIGKDALRRTRLPKLAEAGSGWASERLFDPVKGRWRWSAIAAQDFASRS